MKKFLALIAFFALSSAYAEELKFGDLNYFLKQGQFNVGANLIVNNEASRFNKTDKIEVDGYFLRTHYAYAVTDVFNVALGVDTLLDGETETNAGASQDTYGLQNPSLGVNYRVLNQDKSGINLDLGLVAAFKFFDRKVASQTRVGNMIHPFYSNYSDPRNSFEFNARIGRKWNEANEFYLLGSATHRTDGEYEDLSSEKVNLDPSTDLKFGVLYQYRPVNEFMMTLGLSTQRFGEVDFYNGVQEYSRTDYMDYQFTFDAKYLIAENFIAKFLFSHDKRTDFEVEKGALTSKMDRRNASQYGLGVDFLF